MKEKTKLRIVQILCIISLLITVFSIQRTFARYFEVVDTTYDTNIKRWVINVNTKNIHEETTLSNVMTPVLRENQYMNSNNTLVPGREGYFEFLIDYSQVDLSFRFEFDIEQLNNTPLEDFEIYGYSIVETDATTGEQTETKTEIATVNDMSLLTQVIDPTVESDVNKKMQLRILFRWNDANADTTDVNSVAGMNNFEDTQFTGENPAADATDQLHKLLNYNVRIKFIQQL